MKLQIARTQGAAICCVLVVGDMIYCCNTGGGKAVLFRGGTPVEVSSKEETGGKAEEETKVPEVRRVFGMFKDKARFPLLTRCGVGSKFVECLRRRGG